MRKFIKVYKKYNEALTLAILCIVTFVILSCSKDKYSNKEIELQRVSISCSYYIGMIAVKQEEAEPVEIATPEPVPEFEQEQEPAYNVTDEERQILYMIVEAEVSGEGDETRYQAKKNVASCVLTRVDNGWADKTIRGVVFDKGQFSPALSGSIYTVEVTQQTRDAVDWVLENGKTHSCEYFCTPNCKSYKSGFHSTLKEVFQDGLHVYFVDGKEEISQ